MSRVIDRDALCGDCGIVATDVHRCFGQCQRAMHMHFLHGCGVDLNMLFLDKDGDSMETLCKDCFKDKAFDQEQHKLKKNAAIAPLAEQIPENLVEQNPIPPAAKGNWREDSLPSGMSKGALYDLISKFTDDQIDKIQASRAQSAEKKTDPCALNCLQPLAESLNLPKSKPKKELMTSIRNRYNDDLIVAAIVANDAKKANAGSPHRKTKNSFPRLLAILSSSHEPLACLELLATRRELQFRQTEENQAYIQSAAVDFNDPSKIVGKLPDLVAFEAWF